MSEKPTPPAETQGVPSLYQNSGPSAIPCDRCGGAVIEFSVPNDIWNAVIRLDGHEQDDEYLCANCFFEAVRKRLNEVATLTRELAERESVIASALELAETNLCIVLDTEDYFWKNVPIGIKQMLNEAREALVAVAKERAE